MMMEAALRLNHLSSTVILVLCLLLQTTMARSIYPVETAVFDSRQYSDYNNIVNNPSLALSGLVNDNFQEKQARQGREPRQEDGSEEAHQPFHRLRRQQRDYPQHAQGQQQSPQIQETDAAATPDRPHNLHKRRLVVRVPFAQSPDQTQLHRLYKTLFANKEKKFL